MVQALKQLIFSQRVPVCQRQSRHIRPAHLQLESRALAPAQPGTAASPAAAGMCHQVQGDWRRQGRDSGLCFDPSFKGWSILSTETVKVRQQRNKHVKGMHSFFVCFSSALNIGHSVCVSSAQLGRNRAKQSQQTNGSVPQTCSC